MYIPQLSDDFDEFGRENVQFLSFSGVAAKNYLVKSGSTEIVILPAGNTNVLLWKNWVFVKRDAKVKCEFVPLLATRFISTQSSYIAGV